MTDLLRVIFLVILVLSLMIPIGVNDVFANDGKNILEIESLEYSGSTGKHNSLVQIDSDTYALAYAGTENDGYISTFTISSDGKTITKLATLEHAPNNGEYNSLVQVDSDTYALAYRDNDVLVYTPQTIESSCEPLGNLASWCTRREGNSYFDSYRKNNPKPDGSLSDYYVVMPKKLFDGEDEEIYPLQFHFESGQLHDKNNRSIERSELPKVLSKFGGLTDFFKKELGALATIDIKQGSGLMDSKYLNYLNKFGGDIKDVIDDEVYAEGVASIRKLASEQQGTLQSNKYLKWLMENTQGVIITDYLNKDMETLDFSDMPLKEIPDISEFKSAQRLSANNCGIEKLPPADHLPNDIEIFTMTNNNIKEAPLDGYEKLTNMFVLNLSENPITKINVKVLSQLTNESLARFVLTKVNLEDLSDENQAEYKEWESDQGGIGFFVN